MTTDDLRDQVGTDASEEKVDILIASGTIFVVMVAALMGVLFQLL